MPKIKTHKSTSKRFRLTGKGKLMRTKIGKGHRRRFKASRVKAQLLEMLPVSGTGVQKRIKRLAPYLKDK